MGHPGHRFKVELLGEAGEVNPLSDVVFDPVGIPPGLGIDLDAIELHGEVDVIASGHAGHATESHDLLAFDEVAFLYVDLAEMAVDGLQSVTVIDDDAVAVNAER